MPRHDERPPGGTPPDGTAPGGTAPVGGSPAGTAPSAEECRDYYRRLTSGVAVVTARGPAGWSASTASTVTSVSLAPPVLLCCLSTGSETLAALRHSGRFAVHLLADHQSDIAERCARPPGGGSRLTDLREEVRLVDGVPVIPGTLAVSWCDLYATTEVGDHVVVYGRLTSVRVGHGRPLLWHDRSFRALDVPAPTLATRL
ncbi:flavin reductase family protein [Streptomyces sp. NPDC090025]|uniref:flavin reductase family protein n=1 Tax=Streptomyces sp. NPDC090025 TaxID=3365922 RepID=UPI003832F88A